MSINDILLIECVRTYPEIYDKGHAGFKNVGIKESAWKIIAETVNAPIKECMTRWQTLRERFVKEKRILEQEGRSGTIASTRPEWPLYSAMSFLSAHIRKRKSVDNFPISVSASISSPILSTDEEVSPLSSLESADNIEMVLEKQAVDDVNTSFKVIATGSSFPSPSPACNSSAAAANMPYLGPTGRCKKLKIDETAEMFKETLANLNKSIAAFSLPSPSLNDINDPDVLIAKNVEYCLKNLTNMTLKLKYRRKFRTIIQDCEEEAEGLKISDL